MVNWLTSYYRSLLIGLLLLVLPVFYFSVTQVSWQPLNPHDHLIQNGFAYLFLVVFTFVNHTMLVPRLFLQKRYYLYAFVVAICIAGIAYLPYRIEQWAFFKPPKHPTVVGWLRRLFVEEMMFDRPNGRTAPFRQMAGPPAGLPGRYAPPAEPPGLPDDRLLSPMFTLPAKLAIFLLLGGISTLISISVQTASRLRQVETNRLQTELRQLRAQIQPHFLFNTLNSIYALALRKDDQTADVIVKLSAFMRYTIREAHREQVPLSHEIDYIDNYIDLQKARLKDTVSVDYQLDGPTGRFAIAPLLLFTFIENAFKYGVSPDEASPIQIHLRIVESELRMDIVNNKVQTSTLEPSTGTGLQNARQRLHLLYPSAHALTICDTPTHFHVTLQLTLV